MITLINKLNNKEVQLVKNWSILMLSSTEITKLISSSDSVMVINKTDRLKVIPLKQSISDHIKNHQYALDTTQIQIINMGENS